ncbi:MAG: hypothetical protein OEY67_06630, partial [Gammaproteobacteria bacterium]|nr:hypothetical protein [Gammaproteobacteria bacterium]
SGWKLPGRVNPLVVGSSPTGPTKFPNYFFFTLYVDGHEFGAVLTHFRALFAVLPLLLKHGLNYYLSIDVSVGTIAACYFATALIYHRYSANGISVGWIVYRERFYDNKTVNSNIVLSEYSPYKSPVKSRRRR